ncbi:MAG: hypothetical protein K5739_08375 [Lachnospiraceae bacterium]|nr:hypothetical protein [Lachnospiraceae bacterium]
MRKAFTNKKFWLALLLVCQLILLICMCGKKQGFHMDEYYTYALANHDGGVDFNFEKGRLYEGKDLYTYLTCESGEVNLKRVWENQAADVHPPFYYLWIHLCSALLPGRFCPWIGLGMNILIALISTVLIWLISGTFFEKDTERLLLTAAAVLMPGMTESVLLIRMYELAMCEILLLTLLHLKMWEKEPGKKCYGALAGVLTIGALTHYYVTIFSIVTAVVFGIRLLLKKQWKRLGAYCGVCAVSGAAAYGVFPAMIDHVFHSYRGEQIREHTTQLSDLWQRVKAFGGFLSKEMFSDILPVLLGAAVILTVFFLVKKKQPKLPAKILLLIIPAAAYFFLIAKASEIISDRYLFPIFPLCFLAVMICLVLPLERYRSVVLAAAIFLSVTGWLRFDFPLLYPKEAQRMETLRECRDSVGIVIGNGEYYRLIPCLEEFAEMDYVVFVDSDSLELLAQHSYRDINAVVWDDRDNPVRKHMKIIKTFNPDWKKSKLFSSGYMKVYDFRRAQ